MLPNFLVGFVWLSALILLLSLIIPALAVYSALATYFRTARVFGAFARKLGIDRIPGILGTVGASGVYRDHLVTLSERSTLSWKGLTPSFVLSLTTKAQGIHALITANNGVVELKPNNKALANRILSSHLKRRIRKLAKGSIRLRGWGIEYSTRQLHTPRHWKQLTDLLISIAHNIE